MSLDALINIVGRPGLVSLYSHADSLWDFLLPHIYNGIAHQGTDLIVASMEGQLSSKLSFLEGSDALVMMSPKSVDQAVQWMADLDDRSFRGMGLAFLFPVFEDARWHDLGTFLVKIVKLSQVFQLFMLFESHNQQTVHDFAPYFKFISEFSPICPVKDETGAVRWLKTSISSETILNNRKRGTPP